MANLPVEIASCYLSLCIPLKTPCNLGSPIILVGDEEFMRVTIQPLPEPCLAYAWKQAAQKGWEISLREKGGLMIDFGLPRDNAAEAEATRCQVNAWVARFCDRLRVPRPDSLKLEQARKAQSDLDNAAALARSNAAGLGNNQSAKDEPAKENQDQNENGNVAEPADSPVPLALDWENLTKELTELYLKNTPPLEIRFDIPGGLDGKSGLTIQTYTLAEMHEHAVSLGSNNLAAQEFATYAQIYLLSTDVNFAAPEIQPQEHTME